ncbi:MAG: SDR family NAD(P)-dependent oxidoreductase [Phycisphaerales bacterium]|nr:MAG: SDR family NAD(P)-dependent oxidoreductase [Phycisphaerales bacterium]
MGYDLKDRIVFITGASSGIGRASAVEYHRAGSRVVAAARSLDKLQELADQLGDDRVFPVAMDVTDPAQRDDALDKSRERFGPIDVLVNNAGWASFSSIYRTPPEHLDRMLKLNIASPIAMIQAVLPEMLERRSGQIVNISSVVGNQPIPRMAVYSATKAAVSSLTTGLRMELKGTGVDVLLVCPGSTNTPFFESAESIDVKAVRFSKSQYSPEQVARAIVQSSRRRRREVTLTVEGKLISLIRRLSHRIADAIMYQVAKRSMPTLKT